MFGSQTAKLRNCTRLLLICVTLAIPASAAAQDAAPASTAAHHTARVEEIVVQARKRAEFLEDTPVSVSVVGATEMRETGVTRLEDIQQLVPNLRISTPSDGQAADIVIRGVGTPQSASIAFDPGVGIYVDGVFLPRAIGTLIDVLDVRQIEVLRGPQGTLFGKNTVGGAVSISTVKPQPELEGFALLRPGSLGQLYTQAMVNLPIVEDKVFTRLSVSTNNTRGYAFNRQYDRWESNRNSLSFLGSVRILPIEDVTIDVSGSWSRDHNHGRLQECVYIGGGTIGNLVSGLQPACESTSPFDGASNIDGISDVQSYGTWGTIAWDPSSGPLEDYVFKYIGSWRQQAPRLRLDNDGSTAEAVFRAGVGGGVHDGLPGSQQQVSQELQVNGSLWDDRIQFVAGAFGFWENGRDAQTLTVVPEVLNIVSLNLREIDNWSWALYTQGTLDVTDWLSLTGGGRYTEDKKGLFAQNTDPRTDDPPTLNQDDSVIFTAWTPMGTIAATLPEDLLDGTPVDHFMTYFTYSRGFRGGGFNGVLNPVATSLDQFEPEYLDSYEWGFKTIAFDQLATLNASVFYNNYDDIQVTTQVDVGDQNGDGIPDIEQTTLNGAKATSHGAELELLTIPIDGLQLHGSVGLLYTEFDEFIGISSLDGTQLDRAGQSFNNAPQLQSHIAVQYSLAVDPGGPEWLRGWVTPRMDWSYQSRVHIIGAEVPQGTQSGYNLLHARLSYDFLDDRAQIALWGKNLTDETYFQWVSPVVSSFGIATRIYNEPRTFGGELSYRF
ncbi:MAG: TonB-dependent receptor [Candidatus Binatia bacterium]|nr:TonB-dependent receptor [Candidatus Binatia bacterium]